MKPIFKVFTFGVVLLLSEPVFCEFFKLYMTMNQLLTRSLGNVIESMLKLISVAVNNPES